MRRPSWPARRTAPRSPARVLLLDDTYVSGARAQSAAAALSLAAARSTLIVPLGRVLRPDRVALHADFLRRHAGLKVAADRARRPASALGSLGRHGGAELVGQRHGHHALLVTDRGRRRRGEDEGPDDLASTVYG